MKFVDEYRNATIAKYAMNLKRVLLVGAVCLCACSAQAPLFAQAPEPKSAEAKSIVVHPGESLQKAIDAANEGDTIQLEDGVYELSVDESLRLKKGMSLIGVGNKTIIRQRLTQFTGRKPAVRGADDITIAGLKIEAEGTGLFLYRTQNTAIHDIEVASYAPLTLTGAKQGKFEKCRFISNVKKNGEDISHGAVVLNDCDDLHFSDNYIMGSVLVQSSINNKFVRNIITRLPTAEEQEPTVLGFGLFSHDNVFDFCTLYCPLDKHTESETYKFAPMIYGGRQATENHIRNSIIASGNPSLTRTRVDANSMIYINDSLIDRNLTDGFPLPKTNKVDDPLFTDADHGDFTLKPGSPAIGADKDGGDLGAVPFKKAPERNAP